MAKKFKPHMMYKKCKGVMAETFKDHLKLKKKGIVLLPTTIFCKIKEQDMMFIIFTELFDYYGVKMWYCWSSKCRKIYFV